MLPWDEECHFNFLILCFMDLPPVLSFLFFLGCHHFFFVFVFFCMHLFSWIQTDNNKYMLFTKYKQLSLKNLFHFQKN